MNKLGLLFKINIQSIFNPTKIVTSGYETKRRSNWFGIFVVLFIAVAMLFSVTSYMMLLAMFLEPVGMLDLLPLLAMIACTILILFTSIYQAQSYLFSGKDMEFLLSIPVSKLTIMMSKLSTLYVEALLLSGMILLPAAGVYSYYGYGTVGFWATFLMGWFFIPLIPLIISIVIGYIFGLISTRFKAKNIISIVLNMALVIIIMYFSINMQSLLNEIVKNATSIQDMYFKMYMPAKFYYNAIMNSNLYNLLIFIILSVIPFVLFSAILSKMYIKIVSHLSASVKKSNYKYKQLKSSSHIKALYRKELGRYFSSYIYVLNTSIGMIMLVAMSAIILFAGSEFLEQILEIPGISSYIPMVSIAFMCVLVSMCSTTSCSISTEGINLWILKTSAVKTSEIFIAKIMVNLTVILPLLYLSIILFSFSVEYTTLQLVIAILLPTIIAVFVSLFGLLVNLKFPRLDAISDVVIAKQSLSSMISIFVPMLIMIGLSILYPFVLAEIFSFEIYCLIVGLVLFLLVLTCIIIIDKKGKKLFENLYD